MRVQKIWEKVFEFGPFSYLLGSAGIAVAVSEEGRYLVLDEADGRVSVQGRVPEGTVAPPTIADGYLLLPTLRTIYAVDLVEHVYGTSSGDWSATLAGELKAIGTCPEREWLLTLAHDVRENKLVFQAYSPEKRGTVGVTVTLPAQDLPLPQLVSGPDFVLAGWRDGRLVALSLETGKVLAVKQHPAGLRLLRRKSKDRFMLLDDRKHLFHVFLDQAQIQCALVSTSDQHTVYAVGSNQFASICCRGGNLCRIGAQGGEDDIDVPGHVLDTTPLMRGSLAFVLTQNGTLFGVNTNQATLGLVEISRLLTGEDHPSAPLVATQGSLLVAGEGGSICRFRVTAA